MIYLDYSATTPVNKEVLDTFTRVSNDFIGNPNSLHLLGTKSNELISNATTMIAKLLNIKEKEIIYTSGASESNNTVIKGICLKSSNRKHIITSHFEHSSINSPLSYLESLGYEIEYVNTDSNGIVDLDHLKSILRKDTCLVTIGAINSEIGIIEPINEIGKIVKEYSNAYYHSDITQLVGKKKFSLENVDLASFSAHKFYGLKGIGCLIKKENIELIPLIHGGKSTTMYRSGTPSPALIASLAKALRLSYEQLDKYDYIKSLNDYIKDNLNKEIVINSNDYCIPHILNLSVVGIKPETILHALEKYDIYISTKTACSNNDDISIPVYYLTNNKDLASSSIRISLSYLTSKEEVEYFVKILNQEVESLVNLNK